MKNTQILALQHQVYDTKCLVNILVTALQGQSDRFGNRGNIEETETIEEFFDGVLNLLEDISERLETIYRKLDTFKHLPDPVSVAKTLDLVNFPNCQKMHHVEPANGGRVTVS